jgi:hypothetical protein
MWRVSSDMDVIDLNETVLYQHHRCRHLRTKMGKECPVYVRRTDLEAHMTSARILPLAIMLATTSMFGQSQHRLQQVDSRPEIGRSVISSRVTAVGVQNPPRYAAGPDLETPGNS